MKQFLFLCAMLIISAGAENTIQEYSKTEIEDLKGPSECLEVILVFPFAATIYSFTRCLYKEGFDALECMAEDAPLTAFVSFFASALWCYLLQS